MERAKAYLVEWTENFINGRNAVFRNLVSLEKGKGGFDLIATYKDHERYFIVEPMISLEVLDRLDPAKSYGLVTLNTKANFKAISDGWDRLVGFKNLTIYSVNPFSALDKKWIICPYTHKKICDEGSLHKGLKSMFDMVEPLNEKDIQENFK